MSSWPSTLWVMAVQEEYDVAIIASADTDLLPVVEGLLALRKETGRPDVEVVGWAGLGRHLRAEGVPVRWIAKRDYEAVRDRNDYNIRSSERTARTR